MKTVIRFFALFVAIAGLACASLAPANTQVRAAHNSVAATDPGPLVNLPAPLPCQSVGACFASPQSSR
jgi:hypothetical protein